MKRSVLCVSAAILLCLALLPGPTSAQTDIRIVEEDIVMTRTNYPPVKPSEGLVRIYAGEWQLTVSAHNYGETVYSWISLVSCKIFVDNVLTGTLVLSSYVYGGGAFFGGTTETDDKTISFSKSGDHEVRIEVWHGTETTPQDAYSFGVLVVKPEITGLQASSRVVRARGDNVLTVSFTNGGNENMRQAVLSVADPKGLTVMPNSVELGDVRAGESKSASFTVSSPAGVALGTALVRFSLSFIDYAGVSHAEEITGEVEVYRMASTLTVSAPGSVENGTTVEIAATLRDTQGNPIANENIAFTARGAAIGSARTDSNGVARLSYRVAETGTLNVGASFAGSASYDASSASGELAVTPAAAFPYWVILLIVPPAALAAVLMIWRRKRGEVRPARKVRRSKSGVSG